MSTTRSTPETAAYTVVENTVSGNGASSMGIVVLNRGSRLLRDGYLESLVDIGYGEVVLVESQKNSYTVENFSNRYPVLRFILMDEDATPGEQINTAFSEMKSDLVLVTWSNVEPIRISEVIASRFRTEAAVVHAPILRGDTGETMPTVSVPVLQKRTLKIDTVVARRDMMKTIFPADYIGIYDRKKFNEIGGYDIDISNRYWQKLDFGFRTHLWGERIVITTGLRLHYRSNPEPEDHTPDRDYPLFYLKNLGIRMGRDGATIPFFQVLSFLFKSGSSPMRALSVFRKARRWVRAERERYLFDAKSLVQSWMVEER